MTVDFQQFTPSEQACISEHVSKKVKEGWEQDQAVAAAINI